MALASLCAGYAVEDMGASNPPGTAPNCTSDQGQRRGFVRFGRGRIDHLVHAHGLGFDARAVLRELIEEADYRDGNRGAVDGFTVTAWSEYLGIPRRRLSAALAALEAAGLIERESHSGHPGTLWVTAYDDVVPVGRADARDSAEPGRADTRDQHPGGRADMRDRPAETTPKNTREKNPPTPHVSEHPESPRAEAPGGDPKHDLAKVRVRATVDALREQLAADGQPVPLWWSRSEPLIADQLAAGWTPDALAQRLTCPRTWPGSPMRDPDSVIARRLRDERLGPAPRPAPRPGRDCPACEGNRWIEDDNGLMHRCEHCDGTGRIDNEATA